MNDNDLAVVAMVLVAVLFFFAIAAFYGFVWWRIVSRTGHSGWLSLLMFVPIANLVLILILAFGEWPILRELDDLRRRSRVAETG